MPVFKGNTLADAAPPDVAASGSTGTSTDMAREDHTHGHGNQAGGALHADVVASGASGFMSGVDKNKLNGIAVGATNTPIGSSTPSVVVRDFVGGSAGSSTNAAAEDHVHAEDPKTVYFDSEQTYDPSTRQTFGPELVGKCGLNVGSVLGDPADLLDGDIWYDSNKHAFRAHVNGASKDVQVEYTPPGGSNTYIQFNDSGALGGDADLTFDKATNVLSVGAGTTVGRLDLTVSPAASAGSQTDPAIRLGVSDVGLYYDLGSDSVAITASGAWVAYLANNGSEQSFMRMNNGNIPATTTPVANSLYEKNLPKAWACLTTNAAGGVTINDGFNIASATISGNNILVNFSVAFANTNYCIVVSSMDGTNEHYVSGTTKTTTQMEIRAFDADSGVQHNCGTTTRRVSLICFGQQT